MSPIGLTDHTNVTSDIQSETKIPRGQVYNIRCFDDSNVTFDASSRDPVILSLRLYNTTGTPQVVHYQ